MQKEFIIHSVTGIHARPAKKIVEIALAYPFPIYLLKHGEPFNAKSLVAMISIGALHGDRIIVTAIGDDASTAIEAIGRILTATY